MPLNDTGSVPAVPSVLQLAARTIASYLCPAIIGEAVFVDCHVDAYGIVHGCIYQACRPCVDSWIDITQRYVKRICDRLALQPCGQVSGSVNINICRLFLFVQKG